MKCKYCKVKVQEKTEKNTCKDCGKPLCFGCILDEGIEVFYGREKSIICGDCYEKSLRPDQKE